MTLPDEIRQQQCKPGEHDSEFIKETPCGPWDVDTHYRCRRCGLTYIVCESDTR